MSNVIGVRFVVVVGEFKLGLVGEVGEDFEDGDWLVRVDDMVIGLMSGMICV